MYMYTHTMYTLHTKPDCMHTAYAQLCTYVPHLRVWNFVHMRMREHLCMCMQDQSTGAHVIMRR